MNISSSAFHSYSFEDSNYYAPIQDPSISIDSLSSSITELTNPLKASSPNPQNQVEHACSETPFRFNHHPNAQQNSTSSSSQTRNKKKKLRAMNVNAQSIRGKRSEFDAVL